MAVKVSFEQLEVTLVGSLLTSKPALRTITSLVYMRARYVIKAATVTVTVAARIRPLSSSAGLDGSGGMSSGADMLAGRNSQSRVRDYIRDVEGDRGKTTRKKKEDQTNRLLNLGRRQG